MLTFSASKVKTFHSCRRSYYYKYIEHLESKSGARAVLGRCVHKAIELGFQGEDPLQIFAHEWAEQSQEIEDRKGIGRIYDEGLKMLIQYNFEQTPPIEMEIGFELPFPDAEQPVCIMQGYIDQIFPGHIVVDLKTGLRRPLRGVLNNNPQFVIYNWAYEQLYGETPEIFWHHLRTGEMIQADVRGPEKVKEIVDALLEIMEFRDFGDDIRAYHRNVGTECSYCPFRKPCLGVEE